MPWVGRVTQNTNIFYLGLSANHMVFYQNTIYNYISCIFSVVGQAIPRGLHVRMNLQTGVKEAKLLSEDDETESTATPAPDIAAKGDHLQ